MLDKSGQSIHWKHLHPYCWTKQEREELSNQLNKLGFGKMASDKEIILLVNEAKQNSEKYVASMVLATLRHLRGNCPNEWDSLLKSDEDNAMVTLWDLLKGIEEK